MVSYGKLKKKKKNQPPKVVSQMDMKLGGGIMIAGPAKKSQGSKSEVEQQVGHFELNQPFGVNLRTHTLHFYSGFCPSHNWKRVCEDFTVVLVWLVRVKNNGKGAICGPLPIFSGPWHGKKKKRHLTLATRLEVRLSEKQVPLPLINLFICCQTFLYIQRYK